MRTPKKKTKKKVVRKAPLPAPISGDPDRVWMSIERKFNLGNYENVTVHLGASSSVDLGETQSAATKRVLDHLKEDYEKCVEEVRGVC